MVDSKENDKFELGVKGLNQTNPQTSLMTLALQNIKLLLPYPVRRENTYSFQLQFDENLVKVFTWTILPEFNKIIPVKLFSNGKP